MGSDGVIVSAMKIAECTAGSRDLAGDFVATATGRHGAECNYVRTNFRNDATRAGEKSFLCLEPLKRSPLGNGAGKGAPSARVTLRTSLMYSTVSLREAGRKEMER